VTTRRTSSALYARHFGRPRTGAETQPKIFVSIAPVNYGGVTGGGSYWRKRSAGDSDR
jgi:hypothetical protein